MFTQEHDSCRVRRFVEQRPVLTTALVIVAIEKFDL
jgi:hypothetical protein